MHSCVIHAVHARLPADNFYCRVYLTFGCFFIIIFSKICIFVNIHIHAGHIINGESGVRRRKTVFTYIESIQFNLSRYTQPHCLINDFKGNKHYCQYISRYADYTQRLDSKLSETAAVKQTGAHTVSAVAEQSDCQSTPDPVYHMD